jgi:hypothetical protein
MAEVVIFLYLVFLSFQFCKDYGMDYLVWRVWIGMWIVVICTLVVALEGCFLVKYFTRFTEEIFACLISFIFVYEALKFLYEVNANRKCFFKALFHVTTHKFSNIIVHGGYSVSRYFEKKF